MIMLPQEKRRHIRTTPDSDPSSVIEIRHTFGPQRTSVFKINEFDEYGLSFFIPVTKGYFRPGTPLEYSIKSGSKRKKGFGIVRYYTKCNNDKGLFDTREQCLATYGSARLAGTHKAFNSAVQGSAADQMKHAIIELSNNGYLPMLQVYDECAVSITNLDEAREISNIMEEVVDKKLGLTVPSLVDPEIGPNWGRTKKIENM